MYGGGTGELICLTLILKDMNNNNIALACPWSEPDRLASLASYGILDTLPEQSFDDIVLLVSQLFDAPIVAVNLIAERRQWFKSELGLGVREMPLENSICSIAILQGDAMVVPDTLADARFDGNALVQGGPGLRFYAGVVLRTPDGFPLGTLCVLDTVARPQGVTELQLFALKTLASQVMSQLQLRKVVRQQQDDIRQCKEAEARLRASEEQLSESNRRQTEFLATLAHELRNPLAPIRSGLGVMRMGADNPAVMAKVRDMMERQVTHMVRLIDDLLDIARISGGKLDLIREQTELKNVLFSAVETSLPLIEAGQHALVLQISDESMLVDVDATRIGQVVSNLLNNAAKYTPSGGRITLSASPDGNDALICVTDDGVGIPEESLAGVFDMFSQVGRNLDRAQDGLGIGLSLVQRLVTMHGGSVTARSAGPGEGCSFSVRLPLLHSEAPRLAVVNDSPPVAENAARGLRILVADDNVDAADTLATILELFGHTTRVAHDGLQALAMAAEFQPDAAFLDIGMPGLNGYQAARRLRATPGLEHVVLMALTGWGAENDHVLASEAGFDYHLTKPVDIDVVSKLLAALPDAQPARRDMLQVVR
jgi:signal transduction histidine kinase/ActR/RegA family two-component response regulator